MELKVSYYLRWGGRGVLQSCVCAWDHAYICGSQRKMSCSSNFLHSLETGWLTEFGACYFSAKLTVSRAQQSSCPCLLKHWDYEHTSCQAFYVGTEDPNTGCHACVASTHYPLSHLSSPFPSICTILFLHLDTQTTAIISHVSNNTQQGSYPKVIGVE